MRLGREVRAAWLTSAAIAFASPALAGLLGDVDADCDIDIADAVLLERSLAGFVTLSDEQADNADLIPIDGSSNDGVTDVGDLVTLKRLVARDEDPDENPGTPLATPVIDTVTGTNPVLVTGSAAPASSTITLYVNGRRHPHTVTADGAGDFSFDGTHGFLQVPLDDGQNQITVVASTGSGQSCSSIAESKTFTPPNPTLANPPDPITANTVWTPGSFNGPVMIDPADFVVPADTALFIQPGVEIEFTGTGVNGRRILVVGGGSLQIRGTAENKVHLGPAGGICSGNRWQGIVINAGFQSLPPHVIHHAEIDCVSTAVSVSGSARFEVRFSEIRRWSGTGVAVTSGGVTGFVQDNVMDFNPGGVGIGTRGAIAIDRNVIRANTNGITISDDKVPTSLTGNDIRGGSTSGILIRTGTPTPSAFTIEGNTIVDNCNGVVLDRTVSNAVPTLLHNAIYGNDDCPSACSSGSSTICNNYTTFVSGFPGCGNPPPTLPATENWWGDTDLATIEAALYGYCSSPAPIEFIPYLSGPFVEGGIPVGGANVIQGDISNLTPPPAGSNWIVLGTATVPEDETLNIPDGTTIEFAEDSQLVVQGTLIVEDTSAADVLFTSLVVPGGTPAPGDWKGIRIEAGATAASATIADAVIEYGNPAIEVTGLQSHLDLSGSILRHFSGAGVRVENDATANIHDNRDVGGTLGIFAGPGKDGVAIKDIDLTFDVIVDNNEIANAQAAVRTENASPKLRGNLLRSSNFGIFVGETGSPLITSITGPTPIPNEITGNCWGIYVDAPMTQPTPIVQENKIHTNNRCPGNGSGNFNYYVARYGTGSTLELTADSNWWGGNPSVATDIADSIFDRAEATALNALPTVNFVPFYTDSSLTTHDPGNYLLGPVMGVLGAGTHFVVGDLFVASGQVWQIDPNAILEFPQGYQLIVEGELKILGTTGSDVILRKAAGVTSWSGIFASGPGASLDIQFADISGASRTIEVTNTSQPVSITDSIFSAFSNTAIFLDDVGDALLERNTIDNTGFGSGGTGVSAVDSIVSLVDGNLIRKVAVGVLVAGSNSTPTIGSTTSAANQIEDFLQLGIIFTSVPGGDIANNVIENADVMPRIGTGILLDASSPTVHNNEIRYTDLGIHVLGASSPVIGEVSPALVPHNTITLNRIGIRLEGTPSGTSADQPNPTIQRNNLVLNDVADLEVVGYSPDTNFTIDAKENWWGFTGAGADAAIRARILLDPSNPRPVDFSNYLSANDGMTPSGNADLFSTIITRVTRTAPAFSPTLGETVGITVDTVGPATNIDLDIYEEDDDARATPIYKDTAVGVVASHQFTWTGHYNQGVQSGEFVEDEAYVYVLTASSVGSYDPPRVATGTRAQGVGAATENYNVFENDFMKLVFDMEIAPGRTSLQLITQSQGGTLIRTLFADRVFAQTALASPDPPRDPHHLLYDGRDPAGLFESDAQTSRWFYVKVPTDLHPNHVIVERTRPRIQPTDYSPAVPRLEVLSDPYLVINSYDQVSTIVFQLDQPADVEVKIFDEQMMQVGPDLVPTLLASPPDNTYSVTWSGVDALTVNDTYDLEDGSYTFAITASNTGQPALSTTYRGVIQVRK